MRGILVGTTLVAASTLLVVGCADVVRKASVECLSDGTCVAPTTCQTAVCVDGSCQFDVTEGFCLESGACFESGASKDGSPCTICDPTQSVTALSAKDCGGGTCNEETGECLDPGPTCAAYCDTIMAACSPEEGLAEYPSAEACLAYCTTHAALESGTDQDTQTNTIGCRIYHADVAANTDPEIHCPHAGPSGGDACGTWCENYCALALKNCSGTFSFFGEGEPATECAEACATFAASGQPNDTAGDTVQCRITYLGLAGDLSSGGPDVHCPSGSPTSSECAGGGTGPTWLVVNELDYDTEGAQRFVEIYNPTDESISTENVSLRWVDANGNSVEKAPLISLQSLGSIPPGGFAVVGEPSVIVSLDVKVPTKVVEFRSTVDGSTPLGPAKHVSLVEEIPGESGTQEASLDLADLEDSGPTESLCRCPDGGGVIRSLSPSPGGTNATCPNE